MTNKEDYNIYFVDCFNTIIIRNANRKKIFQDWAKLLGKEFNISWKEIYHSFNFINFYMCLAIFFKKGILQESFRNVLFKLYQKLLKRYKNLVQNDFINKALDCYDKVEMKDQIANQELVKFLRGKKAESKKIFLVSDFYCPKETLIKWLKNLQLDDIFDDIFSSCDFNKEKSNTKLYKYIIQTMAINNSDIFMLGDNVWSDIIMAKLCKIKAKRIKYGK